MGIGFNSIPSNVRIPFVAVEFDSSKAQGGPALLAYKAIIIGQKLTTGTAVVDALVKCTSVDQAIILGGRGSMIHRQALAWFSSNKTTELWLGVVADNAAGAAAIGTITVGGPATATGTIQLYLGGVLVSVPVTIGDASTVIATNIGAAITLAVDLPVTAAVSTSVVTITFRHKGTAGNSYDVRANFRDGDVLPAGVTLAFVAVGTTTAGTTNPTLTNIIAAMADIWFQIWTHPYTDATSLTAIEAELALRFGPMRQQQAVAITSAAGTFSVLTTLGTGRNSPHSVIFAQTGAAPLTPPMEFAADTAAVIAFYGAADPGRPFQTLALGRALATAESDQFDISERNLMLFAGIATTKRVVGGSVQIERAITTYETSPSGAADTAYLDVTTLLTLLYIRFAFVTRIQNGYPRHKLADDGTRFGSGQKVMTPLLGKGEAILWFREMESLGLVENFDQFKRDLLCARSTTDPNRLEWLLPPDLINQLIVGAAQIQFRL